MAQPIQLAKDKNDMHVDIYFGDWQALDRPYTDCNRIIPWEVKEDQKLEPALVTVKEVTHCKQWSISLTDLAKSDTVDEAPLSTEPFASVARIKTANYQSYEITGIVQDGQHATVHVDLIYQLTSSGRALTKATGNADPSMHVDPHMDKNKCRFEHRGEMIRCAGDDVTFTRFDGGWLPDKEVAL